MWKEISTISNKDMSFGERLRSNYLESLKELSGSASTAEVVLEK